MARPFSQLPAFLDQTVNNIDENTARLVKKVYIEIGDTLINDTPVDSGKARSNWQGTVDAPATGVIPPYAPGSKLGKGETANAQAAQAQIRSARSLFRLGRNRALFLTNNVPYIGLLNDGSSTQTAANFVEKAVQRGQRVVQNTRSLTQRPRRR